MDRGGFFLSPGTTGPMLPVCWDPEPICCKNSPTERSTPIGQSDLRRLRGQNRFGIMLVRLGVVPHEAVMQKVKSLPTPPDLVAYVARDPVAKAEQVAQRVEKHGAKQPWLSDHETADQSSQYHPGGQAP